MSSTALVKTLLLVAIVSAPLIITSSANSQTSVIPVWEIKSGGEVLGFFISYDTNIVFGVKVDTTTIPITITSDADGLVLGGPGLGVYYTDVGCVGTPYVADHIQDWVNAATILLGATYAIGPEPNSPNYLQLYAGTGPAVPDPGLQSYFSYGACFDNASTIGKYREAVSVFGFPFGTPIPPGSITLE